MAGWRRGGGAASHNSRGHIRACGGMRSVSAEVFHLCCALCAMLCLQICAAGACPSQPAIVLWRTACGDWWATNSGGLTEATLVGRLIALMGFRLSASSFHCVYCMHFPEQSPLGLFTTHY